MAAAAPGPEDELQEEGGLRLKTLARGERVARSAG
jgi:hypothetical protein